MRSREHAKDLEASAVRVLVREKSEKSTPFKAGFKKAFCKLDILVPVAYSCIFMCVHAFLAHVMPVRIVVRNYQCFKAGGQKLT